MKCNQIYKALTLKYKLFAACFFVLSATCGAEDLKVPVGSPVMEPALNAYIPEQDLSLKLLLSSGATFTKFSVFNVGDADLFNIIGNEKRIGKSFANFGFKALLSKRFVEPGIFFNYGTYGKDNRIIDFGAELRLGLGWLKYFEPFYLKTSLGYSNLGTTLRYSNSLLYYSQKGIEAGLGAGFAFAILKRTIISFDFEAKRNLSNSINIGLNGRNIDAKSTSDEESKAQVLKSGTMTLTVGWII